MSDKVKTRLAILSYLSMLVLPVMSLAFGWIGWGIRVGALAAVVTSATCFMAGGLLLATVEDLSWSAVWAPFSLAVVYALLPDFLFGQFDDATALAAGTLMTFGLWLRKQPDTPKWVVFPLLVAGVYTLVGSVIPGPVDELLVATIGVGTAVAGSVIARLRRPGNESLVTSTENPIDANFATLED